MEDLRLIRVQGLPLFDLEKPDWPQPDEFYWDREPSFRIQGREHPSFDHEAVNSYTVSGRMCRYIAGCHYANVRRKRAALSEVQSDYLDSVYFWRGVCDTRASIGFTGQGGTEPRPRFVLYLEDFVLQGFVHWLASQPPPRTSCLDYQIDAKLVETLRVAAGAGGIDTRCDQAQKVLFALYGEAVAVADLGSNNGSPYEPGLPENIDFTRRAMAWQSLKSRREVAVKMPGGKVEIMKIKGRRRNES